MGRGLVVRVDIFNASEVLGLNQQIAPLGAISPDLFYIQSMVQTRVINPFPGPSSNPTYPHSCQHGLEDQIAVQTNCTDSQIHFPLALDVTNSGHVIRDCLSA